MVKKIGACLVCTVLALGATAALADTVEVSVYDPQGEIVTGGSLLVLDGSGQVIKSVARPDGVFEINALVGAKIDMYFMSGAASIAAKPFKFSEVVPGTLLISANMTDGATPSNDEACDATPISVPSLTSGSTTSATFDGAEFCGTSNTAPGVWYTLTGTGNEISASTCPSNSSGTADYDSKISVYCMDCEEQTCVTGNDDSPGCSLIFRSTATWCSQAGATYLILVHGFSSAVGTFDMDVFESGGACTPDVECLPTGACCSCLNPPFDCTIADVDSCLRLGGIPRGAGTQCTTVIPGSEIDYVSNPGLFITVGSPISDTITVTEAVPIQDVNVDLGITHTWIGDLDIEITSPAGTTLRIWDGRCGSTDNINATADDEGTESLCAVINAGPIDSVFYSPVVAGLGPLSVFDGEIAAGVWTIDITDTAFGDDGTLDQWSLHFVETNPTCDLNVTVCHNGTTIVVGQTSVPAHLNHGDTLGPCSGGGGGGDGDFGRN